MQALGCQSKDTVMHHKTLAASRLDNYGYHPGLSVGVGKMITSA